MGILNEGELKNRIELSDYKKKLVITPLLTEKQIGPASIDIRLGSSIIIPQKTYVDKQDVTDKNSIRQTEARLYEHKRLRLHSKFMLHPNQLILGVTFEYLSLPFDIACMIMSRTSRNFKELFATNS